MKSFKNRFKTFIRPCKKLHVLPVAFGHIWALFATTDNNMAGMDLEPPFVTSQSAGFPEGLM